MYRETAVKKNPQIVKQCLFLTSKTFELHYPSIMRPLSRLELIWKQAASTLSIEHSVRPNHFSISISFTIKSQAEAHFTNQEIKSLGVLRTER